MVNKDEHFVDESKKTNPHTAYAGLIQKQEHEFAPLRFGKVIFGRKYAENSVAVCTHSLQHGYAIDKDVVGRSSCSFGAVCYHRNNVLADLTKVMSSPVI